MLKYFNIRVYQIIFNEKRELLLSDEFIWSQNFTKLPGGGLELGEGIQDCIYREAMEEFGQTVKIIDHFYTTEFFQESYGNPEKQLISIYYRTRFTEPPRFRISTIPYDYESLEKGAQAFRWLPFDEIHPDIFQLPIDKVVAQLIVNKKPY